MLWHTALRFSASLRIGNAEIIQLFFPLAIAWLWESLPFTLP